MWYSAFLTRAPSRARERKNASPKTATRRLDLAIEKNKILDEMPTNRQAFEVNSHA